MASLESLYKKSVIPNGTTSSDIATALSDETGTGSVVFATNPTLVSPSLTGTPTAPTAAAGTNTTQVATTAFVTNALSSAPGGTVQGFGSDNQIAVWTAVNNTLEGDIALTFDSSNDTLRVGSSGKFAFGTAVILDDTAGVTTLSNIDAIDATTEATIEAAIDTLNNLSLTGVPTAPTATPGTNTTQLATTAFVTTAVTGTLSSSTTSTQNGYFGDIFLYDDSTPSHYLQVTNSANLTAQRTLSVNVNDANRTLNLSGDLTLAGSLATSGANALTLTTTGATNVTLPTSGTLATTANTLSSSTTATQNGYFGDIFLYDDNTPSHYLQVTNSANLTAQRILSVNVNDADRTLNLAGDLTLAGNFVTSGANALTLTTTGATNVTLPTSGTLATTANNLGTFATTTSAQLAGVISDETGTGALVFANSPALAGTPTAPTAAPGTNTTQLATTEFVQTALSGVTVSTESIQDAAAPLFTNGVHSGVSFAYDDANNRVNATVDPLLRPNTVALASNTVDCSLGDNFTRTISANSTFTFSNAPAGKGFAFILRLTLSGGPTVTWPGTVRWPGGTAPQLATNTTNIFSFFTDDGGTTWYGTSKLAYA